MNWTWDGARSPADNARELLPEYARQYFEEGAKAVHPKAKAAQLHKFRLASKSMRYTLELFTPIYGPGLKRLVESVKELQTLLGEINDCETILEMRLEEAAFAAWLRSRAQERRKRFFECWNQGLGTEAEQRRFILYLARQARNLTGA